MNINIKQAILDQKPILEKLLSEYLQEFHSFDNEVSVDVKDYKYLDLYWQEKERFPFLVYVDDKLAGFVLVNEHSISKENKGAKAIAEFFILPKFRNRGIGEKVAFRVFEKFPGKWEVTAMEKNKIGVIFWEKVIGNFTKGKFKKIILNNKSHRGPVYSFTN